MAESKPVEYARLSAILQVSRLLTASAGALILLVSVFGAELKFFTLHPVCAVVWFVAVSEAIIQGQLARRSKGAKARELSLGSHWQVATIAVLGLLTAFSVAYINKDLHNKNHFISWHAYAGLTTVTVAGIQLAIGYWAHYAAEEAGKRIGRYVILKLIPFFCLTNHSTAAPCGGSACTASLATSPWRARP